MSKGNRCNIAASVKARLMNLARRDNKPFLELLQYFAMERFLYRLSISPYSDQFVLKGALLLHVWQVKDRRATKDIDLLGKTNNSPGCIEEIVKEICDVRVEVPDGILFHSNSVSTRIMQKQSKQCGIRASFLATSEKAKISMQIDMGFGDVVIPDPESLFYPTLLNFPAPQLLCNPVETVLAEKFHSVVEKGLMNSRSKDFHDLWILLRRGGFDFSSLEHAVKCTFQNRGYTWSKKILVESLSSYGREPRCQSLWKSYRKKGEYHSAPEHLSDLCLEIICHLDWLA